jgi:outer membrane protein assembly factor BamB
VLACLDAATGKVIWKVDFVNDLGTPKPDFGFASSPLLWNGHIYVQAGASFAKLDKLTGKVIWRTLQDDGGMYGSAFSSPIVAKLGGVTQLVVQTRAKLAGVEPETGTVLWQEEIPAFRGMNILTPTVVGDAVFTSSYGGRCHLFAVQNEGGQWSVNEIWSNKAQGYMSSPVVIGNHIYLHLRNQRFLCLDAESGEEKWTTTPFGKYWSMIAHGNQILALDQRGELLLINANPNEFELVDRIRVAEDSWAHIAVCGNEVFVRAIDAMMVFEWQ